MSFGGCWRQNRVASDKIVYWRAAADEVGHYCFAVALGCWRLRCATAAEAAMPRDDLLVSLNFRSGTIKLK